jgi:hypothetical protein
MTRGAWVGVWVVAALLAAAAPASADDVATVGTGVNSTFPGGNRGYAAVYASGDWDTGQTSTPDDVTVVSGHDATGARTVTFTDPGSVLVSLDSSCTSVPADPLHEIQCTGPFDATWAFTGNGDDRITVDGGLPADLYPGDGADVVHGGSGNDRVVLNDEPGLTGDQLYGGPGVDEAFYSLSGDVAVSLDDGANDGAPGDSDNVHTDIEDVYASVDGAATVSGDAAANHLVAGSTRGPGFASGGDGADDVGVYAASGTADGGAGDDTVTIATTQGGSALGGPGSDQVQARNTIADSVDCGSGPDTVRADAFDALTKCETALP